jgi:hypothetical protein
MDTDELIEIREQTHGDFFQACLIGQSLKKIIHASVNWERMSADQREALDMIMHKVQRICVGDQYNQDHWADIAGYAQLVARRLGSNV